MNKNSVLTKYSYLIIKLHTFVAGFFLPMALLFAITGALYTFSIKGDYLTDTHIISIQFNTNSPQDIPSLEDLKNTSEKILIEQFSNIKPFPTGSYSIKKSGTSWQFEWTGSQMDFLLEPTEDVGDYKISLKSTGIHRFFVQLHKAKGGLPFKILAGLFAAALLFLFFSGVFISLSRPPLRSLFFKSLGVGIIVFITLAALS